MTDVAVYETYDVASVTKLLLVATLEPLIYRPALLGPRLLALWEFLSKQKQHEASARSTYTSPSPAGSAAHSLSTTEESLQSPAERATAINVLRR